MFRQLLALAGAVCFTTGIGWSQGADPNNPFLGTGDRGETVHILPPQSAVRIAGDPQPEFAPPRSGATVYRASYGSGNLLYHGGPEVFGAGFQPVYWNSSVSGATSTSLGYASLGAELSAFVSAFPDPDGTNYDKSPGDDLGIVQQYGNDPAISPTLANYTALVDAQPTASSITDSGIQSWLAGLFAAGKLAPSSNIIYGTYFPAGMTVSMGGSLSCSSFCGYHSVFSYSGKYIHYAVFPYPNCSGCSLSGLSAADMLTIIMSHEIRETLTDPSDGGVYAWYDRRGYEADDKCAWHNLYQMKRAAGSNFWVQPEYSNGGTVTASGFTYTYPGSGCVVP